MTRMRMPNPFDFGLPLPIPTSAAQPPAVADQTAAPDGDAQRAAVAPSESRSSRFVLDENRMYLDMISMPEPETMPLFLRKPFKPREPTVVDRKASKAFVMALLRIGER